MNPESGPPPLPAMPSVIQTTDDFSDWQPLPKRGLLLFAAWHAGGGGLLVALVLLAGTAIFRTMPPDWSWSLVLVGMGLGSWIGQRRHSRIFWRLDAAGFAVRSGNWWQVDSRVPMSRVQHLDVKRGPLERALGLATLVIYTAGTQMASVSVSLLDADAAETLRDRLGHQLDSGDAL